VCVRARGRAYALLGANHQDAMAGLEKLAPTIAKYTKDCPIPGGHSLQKCVRRRG
jgi:hypothetical protein